MSLPDPKRQIRVRVTPRSPSVEIKVIGNRDPRGADNNVFIWLDTDDDTLHIAVCKADRCYKFREVIDHGSVVEIVQE